MRESETKSFIVSKNLMSEKTHLPDLDYRRLAIQTLGQIRTAAKTPGGKYQTLLTYLSERSGQQIDAAELDRRMRTWFEDMITKILQNPPDWDQDKVLNGKALMDYLIGAQPAFEPKPQAPGAQP